MAEKREFSVGDKVIYGARKGVVISFLFSTRMVDVKFEDGTIDDVHVSTLEIDEDITPPVQHLYAPVNRPAEEAAPEGYTVVSTEKSDLTPYGTISYLVPLDTMTAWKYDLKNMATDYRIGDMVEYVLNGKLFSGAITSFPSEGVAYVDDYEKIMFGWLGRQEKP